MRVGAGIGVGVGIGVGIARQIAQAEARLAGLVGEGCPRARFDPTRQHQQESGRIHLPDGPDNRTGLELHPIPGLLRDKLIGGGHHLGGGVHRNGDRSPAGGARLAKAYPRAAGRVPRPLIILESHRQVAEDHRLSGIDRVVIRIR